MSKACVNCDKRYPGCHSKCETYQKYRQEIEKGKGKRQHDYEYKGYMAHRAWVKRCP